MQIRNHSRTLIFGTALALSVAGMPAAHVLAAAPGNPTTRPHPVVTTTAAPQEVHGSDTPGGWSEEQCQQLGQNIKNDLGHIWWATSQGNAGWISDAWAVYQLDTELASNHCIVVD